jgi:GNAT superfamily N-acetyltransferase
MSLEIAPLDPHADEFDAWYAAYAGAVEAAVGAEEAQVYSLENLRVQWREPTSDLVKEGLVGRLGDRVVAAGLIVMPQYENLDSAYVEVAVVPSEQGRGLGRAMLAHSESAALAHGRTLLNTEIRWRYEHGTDGDAAGGSRDVRFALAAGYRIGLSDVQRWLDTPVDEALLDRLAADAAPHHPAYEIRSWAGPVPDDLAPSWAALDGSLMTEAPTGDLEVEPMVVDVARLRENEELAAKQGRTSYHCVALHDGDVVAYTMIMIGDTPTAYQWGTLVRADHRGHRLGLAVKVANHRLLQRDRPDCTRVSTWNAEVNDHMIGVNELLGFRPVSRMGELQKRL